MGRLDDSMRRVVITGVGVVSPLGVGAKTNWDGLLAGRSGIRSIQSFDTSDLPAKIAGQVPRGETASGLFNPDDWIPPKDQRRMDAFIVYGLAAANQAIADSGWKAERRPMIPDRCGSTISRTPRPTRLLIRSIRSLATSKRVSSRSCPT